MKNEFITETLEEAAERLIKLNRQDAFYEGAKWMQERMYSKEDMEKCWNASYVDAMSLDEITYKPLFFEDFMKQLKKETK